MPGGSAETLGETLGIAMVAAAAQIFVHPLTGFQVASVHSMVVWVAMAGLYK